MRWRKALKQLPVGQVTWPKDMQQTRLLKKYVNRQDIMDYVDLSNEAEITFQMG